MFECATESSGDGKSESWSVISSGHEGLPFIWKHAPKGQKTAIQCQGEEGLFNYLFLSSPAVSHQLVVGKGFRMSLIRKSKPATCCLLLQLGE